MHKPFGGFAAHRDEQAVASKAPENEPKQQGDDADAGDNLTIKVSKKGGKFHSSVDKHDGYGADEMDHQSKEDMAAAHAKAIEEKYGEDATEDAEEKVSPGIHSKVGDYLSKMEQ